MKKLFVVAILALIGLNTAAIHAQGGGFVYAVHVGSLVMDAGEDGSVELSMTDIADPVGAWTIDITYDADVTSVVDCFPREGGVCDLDRGVGFLRVTGASSTGLTRDTVLASITVRCQQVGSSPLSLSVQILGVPEPPMRTEVEIEDGVVTCEEAAEPASTPLPSLPATGGGDSPGNAVEWPLIAIIFAGLAFACGFILRAVPMQRR